MNSAAIGVRSNRRHHRQTNNPVLAQTVSSTIARKLAGSGRGFIFPEPARRVVDHGLTVVLLREAPFASAAGLRIEQETPQSGE